MKVEEHRCGFSGSLVDSTNDCFHDEVRKLLNTPSKNTATEIAAYVSSLAHRRPYHGSLCMDSNAKRLRAQKSNATDLVQAESV